MKPDGKADSALEQLLWSYALGRAYDPATARLTLPVSLPLHEINQMYRATCGITPSRDELNKWLKTLNQFLAREAMKASPYTQDGAP